MLKVALNTDHPNPVYTCRHLGHFCIF